METIKLDLVPGKKMPSLHASQFDDGRAYHVDLTENRVPYTLDGTETISVIIRKCDNTLVSMDIANTFADKSYIEFEVVEQMTACSGFNYGEIILEKNGDRLGSLNFYLVVEQAPDENGITSQSEIKNLNRQITEEVDRILPDMVDEVAEPIINEKVPEKVAELVPSAVATEADEIVPPLVNELVPQAVGDNYYNKTQIDSQFGELPVPATQIVSASGNNLNDYHTPACFFAETGLTNLPTSNDNFIILNYYAKWQNASRYNLVQLAVNATNCKTYARVYTSSNNTWKSWLPLFYDATQLVADVEYNQDETDRIRQNIFGLNASKGENGFLRATGAVQANNGYVTTDYIRIYNGQSFSYRIGHGIELPVICFFTGKDKSYIVSSKTVNGIDGYVSGTFTADQDGYVRITYSKTKNQGYVVFTDNIPDNIRLSINPNTLKDKNILCLGDSIFGNDGEIVSFINDSGAIAVNGAVGGTQVSVRSGASDNFRYFDGVNLVTALCTQNWTDQETAASALSSSYPWIVGRLANLKTVDMSKVDCITMDWGTNDYTSGKTIAEITTAYNTVIDLLQQYYPSVRLLIITPIWRYFGAKADNENGDNKVYNVSTLKEIATAIDNNAKDKRIEALQMYQNMPLSYNTADLYFDSGDSTHLNTTGNKVYTQILLGKLRSMFGLQ